MKILAIIPARMASSRFPGKPLKLINKKPMLYHVYRRAEMFFKKTDLYIATCDDEIATEVGNNGGNFIMTDPKHATGTDRVYEAAQKLKLTEIKIHRVQTKIPINQYARFSQKLGHIQQPFHQQSMQVNY